MQPVLSRAQVRDLDRRASELCGVPSLVLMENAGRGAVEAIAELFGGRLPAGLRVLVVCGPGNNGGDGYVVARRLLVLGAHVDALAVQGEPRDDARVNQAAFVGVGGRLHSYAELDTGAKQALFSRAELIVDALFGTGLDREPAGDARDAIERIGASPARCVALDVPSGLHADTGRVQGAAVRAELTVTFAAHKLGLLTPSGRERAGRLVVKDIGVPLAALGDAGQSAWLVETSDVRAALPPRSVNAHKVSAGRVLVLAGSHGKTGAALLVARGALRAGAGLVTLATWSDLVPLLSGRVLEAMTAALDPERLDESLEPLLASADVVAIGPGFGLDDAARRVVERVVLRHTGTVIADADALTCFSGRAAQLRARAGELVLTPHPGELGRLLGSDAQAVEHDRPSALARAIEQSSACVLLKGPHTLIGAPGELPRVGPAGTPALATGGAGDVLTGVIAALACAVDPFVAAWSGAFVHALSATSWAARQRADRGLLASEIADGIPAAIAELSGDAGALTD